VVDEMQRKKFDSSVKWRSSCYNSQSEAQKLQMSMSPEPQYDS